MDMRVPRSTPPSHTAPRALRKPPLGELQRIAQQYGMDLSPDDLASLGNLMGGVLASYRRLDQFVEPTLPVKYPRQTGRSHYTVTGCTSGMAFVSRAPPC
jgi:amidase